MNSWTNCMSFSAKALSGISPGHITVSAIIDEVYVNDEGVKEFGSDRFNARLQEVLMGYKQSVMNREIMVRSANAILSSRFSQKEIGPFPVYAYSDTEVCISRITRKSNLWIKVYIMTLIEKVNGASRIKDLFIK